MSINNSARNIPIGYFTVSGNSCPEDGVYTSANDNYRTLFWKGDIFSQHHGMDTTWTLNSYWC